MSVSAVRFLDQLERRAPNGEWIAPCEVGGRGRDASANLRDVHALCRAGLIERDQKWMIRLAFR